MLKLHNNSSRPVFIDLQCLHYRIFHPMHSARGVYALSCWGLRTQLEGSMHSVVGVCALNYKLYQGLLHTHLQEPSPFTEVQEEEPSCLRIHPKQSLSSLSLLSSLCQTCYDSNVQHSQYNTMVRGPWVSLKTDLFTYPNKGLIPLSLLSTCALVFQISRRIYIFYKTLYKFWVN